VRADERIGVWDCSTPIVSRVVPSDQGRGVDEPRVGVGTLVHDADGRILLLRRRGAHEGGTWSTPGGHLDPGEDIAACASREAHEETGAIVDGVRFHAVTNDVSRRRAATT
jgi:ADP-ribose pyrophosphatase YjhB (NUDIX family)